MYDVTRAVIYVPVGFLNTVIGANLQYLSVPRYYLTDIEQQYSVVAMIIEAIYVKNYSNVAIKDYLIDDWLLDEFKNSDFIEFVISCVNLVESTEPSMIMAISNITNIEIVDVNSNHAMIVGHV